MGFQAETSAGINSRQHQGGGLCCERRRRTRAIGDAPLHVCGVNPREKLGVTGLVRARDYAVVTSAPRDQSTCSWAAGACLGKVCEQLTSPGLRNAASDFQEILAYFTCSPLA